MNITIASRSHANKLLRKDGGGYRSLISISSVSWDGGSQRPPYWVRQFRGASLFLSFDDDQVSPTPDIVKRIADFGARVHGENRWPMLIHCTAGISRSSASALIVAQANTSDPVDFDKILNPATHWPNEKMLELADQLLDSDLANQNAQWRARHGPCADHD